MRLITSIVSKLKRKLQSAASSKTVSPKELSPEDLKAICYETINYLVSRNILYASSLELKNDYEKYFMTNLGPHLGMGELKLGELETILDRTVGSSQINEDDFFYNLASRSFDDLPFYQRINENADKEKQIRDKLMLDRASLCMIRGVYLLQQVQEQGLVTWSQNNGVIQRNRPPYHQMELPI